MTNLQENWLPIPNYEGLYEISDLGRIKSFPNQVRKTEKILKPFTDPKGYLRIDLFKNKKGKTYKIHRLVMLTFVGESDLAVDHIDENKKNNRLDNLRYCTNRENSIYFHEKRQSSSKYIGVYFNKKTKRWRGIICINKKYVHLGYFDKEEDAAIAYINAKNELDNK